MADVWSMIRDDPEKLLSISPELLAGIFVEMWKRDKPKTIIPYNICCSVDSWQGNSLYRHDLKIHIMEAMAFLISECILIPSPDDSHGITYVLGSRANSLNNAKDISQIGKLEFLPASILHPVIAQHARSTYLQGDYETAVFKAYKQVEIAVRDASGASDKSVGVSLMREAFKQNSGRLTDTTIEAGEQQAMSDMFAGAVGFYRNSTGHRNLDFEPLKAAEAIIHASHLMKIIDERVKSKGSP